MPEKEEVDMPFFGKMMVTTKHVISLQNDRGTQYQAYINVQNVPQMEVGGILYFGGNLSQDQTLR